MQLVAIEASDQGIASVGSADDPVTYVINGTRALYAEFGLQRPWLGYLAVEDNQVVGGCGFAAPPRAGEVEIAYFTFVGHEGRGVATRMAQALLELARSDAEKEGVTFIAHTLPAEGASTSILRKLGFVFVGEILHPTDGLVWKWRKDA